MGTVFTDAELEQIEKEQTRELATVRLRLAEYQTYAITLQKIIMALAGPEPKQGLADLLAVDPVREQLIVWPVAFKLAERIQPLPEGVEYDVIAMVHIDLTQEDACSRIP